MMMPHLSDDVCMYVYADRWSIQTGRYVDVDLYRYGGLEWTRWMMMLVVMMKETEKADEEEDEDEERGRRDRRQSMDRNGKDGRSPFPSSLLLLLKSQARRFLFPARFLC